MIQPEKNQYPPARRAPEPFSFERMSLALLARYKSGPGVATSPQAANPWSIRPDVLSATLLQAGGQQHG
jgi:hypothetical protein